MLIIDRGKKGEACLKNGIDISKVTRFAKTHKPKWVFRKPMLIVSGHQKSGTSVVAAAVGAALSLPVANDSTIEIIWPSCSRLAKSSFYRVFELGACRPVMKEPNYIFNIPSTSQRLNPQYGWIFVRRDPVQIIESILARLELPADTPILDAERFYKLPLAWQWIVSGKGVLGTTGMDIIEALAARIKYAENCIENSPGSNIWYEDFKRDPEYVIETMLLEKKVLQSGLSSDARNRIQDAMRVQYQPSRETAIVNFKLSLEQISKVRRICSGSS